jgi:uncharacterized protein (DUF3820 family)
MSESSVIADHKESEDLKSLREKFFEGIPDDQRPDDPSLPQKKKPRKKKEVVMTWGKYKGKLVKDIIIFDEKYARWLHKHEFVKKFDDIYKLIDAFVLGLPDSQDSKI